MAKTPSETSKTAAAAKSSATKPQGKRKLKKRSKAGKAVTPNFQTYIYRVLKQVHPDIGIGKKAITVMNDLVNDMMDRIATEAKLGVVIGRVGKTLKPWHIQTASRLILPGQVKEHADSEAKKALIKFNAARRKD
ncbi:hypothetical protein ACHAXS_013665 [Conticribra weissflogii]